MFETPRLCGTPKRQIKVETRCGTQLDNFVAPDADFQASQFYQMLRQSYGMNWRPRKPATGVYNCAGMVWASRRTALTNPQQWRVVLQEDNYRKLSKTERPELGDIVVYAKVGSGEILHVARVCEIRRFEGGGMEHARPIIRAVSKWDAKFGEDIHAVSDVFLNGGEQFDVEYWTDRPSTEGIQ